ncbi:MAG: hypothetical protein AAB583_03300 [Patescibacteria group bacterium]
MTEFSQGEEQQYKELSPQQRNAELSKFYQFLPGPIAEKKEYDNKLIKSTKLLEQSIIDGRSNNWLRNHPDYTSDEQLDQIKKRAEEIVQTRENSESRRELTNRLRSLLMYYNGTNAFKEYLIAEFDTLYISGIDKDNPGDEWVFRKLEIDNRESGGIFDEKNTQRLERTAYNHVYFNMLSSHSRLEQVEAVSATLQRVMKLIGDEREVPSFDDFIRRDRDMLRNWRQEYQDKYGVLPND